jgi:hypothetical protein
VKAVFLSSGAGAGNLLDAARSFDTSVRFDVDPNEFRGVPRSPFAYWVSPSLRKIYAVAAATEHGGRQVRTGIATNEDFRWLRCWWEAESGCSEPFAKGGGFARYYADLHLVLLWFKDGRQLKTSKLERFRHGELTENNSKIWNRAFYFRPGVTYTARTQAGFSARLHPEGSLFGHKGPVVFDTQGDATELASICAVLNSAPYRALLALQAIFGSYEIGMLKVTPFPVIGQQQSRRLATLTYQAWSASRGLDAAVEVSHAFVMPAVLQVAAAGFGERCSAWSARVADVEGELVQVQGLIDELCFELYGISEEDRRSIVERFGVADAGAICDQGGTADSDDDDDKDDVGLVELDSVGLAAGLVSWAVGVASGRFDVRLAIGEGGWPLEPDPFDALPVCSPGMLTGDDGLPAPGPPAGYPVSVSPVLVDDPGHPLDVTGRVRSVFDAVFGVEADEWWSSVGEALGARDSEIGCWLTKGFFDYHLKTYSRSRRKAPVLWPIGTKSGSYLVWLYAHQVSADSLFQVLHDVVAPKLGVEERELTRLRQEAGVHALLSQRKAIDMHEQLVGELREMREELEAVAPLWAPDLNDGIVIVLAPLWRLFAHHRPWSNELKKHWTKLAKGDYDWAQLAMHLWPERVIPKCGVDRSLAIAHNLEDTFWVKDLDNDDKWHSRAKPTTPIDELISERHNPAVAAAIRRGTT